MGGIRKGWYAAGARAAMVLLSVILTAVLSQRGGHADEGDKLQGTLVVQIQFSASFQTNWANEGESYSDTLKVSCGGTTTYRWTDTLPEAGQPSDDLKVESANSTLSVSGSGTLVSLAGRSNWSYSAPPTPKQVAFADVIWRNGKLEVPVPWHCQGFRQIGQTTFGGSTEPIDRSEKFGFPNEEASFTDKLKQTFDKKAKSFKLTGEASWQGRCAAFGFDTCSTALASDHSQQATYRLSYSAFFNIGKPPDVEVEMVPPAGYEQWQPQAAEDEKSLGNYIDIGIVAHKKGDPNKPPGQKIVKYTITLADTSREKGVDLNWPPKAPDNAAFDMKIDEDNPWIEITGEKKDAQSAKTKEDDLHEFRVTVNSYDWGGYTKVKVTAQLEDGSTVVGHVRGHPDQDFLALPKDDNSNHIADSWEHKYTIPNPNEDADDDATPPGDGSTGDSIALYDEYRGFHIQGKHESLSPEKKDLFVHDQDNLGVGLYARITKIAVHTLKDNEREQRGEHDVASPNGNGQTVYALWLHKGAIGDGGLGDTSPAPGVPATIWGITIDSAAVAVYYPKYPGTALPATISHELGHATNIRHHNDGMDYLVGDVLCRRPDGSVENFLCSSPVPGKPGVAAANCFLVAVKGGAFSGNDTCVMRYDTAALYENPRGNCEWKFGGQTVRGKKYGQDPPGTSLCPNNKGTGVNAASNPDNKAGDAPEGHGDCEHKFRLK